MPVTTKINKIKNKDSQYRAPVILKNPSQNKTKQKKIGLVEWLKVKALSTNRKKKKDNQFFFLHITEV
jgi:hypothetical protein